MPAPVGREHGDRETFLARAHRAGPPHSFRPTVDLLRVPSATPSRPVSDLVERFAESVMAAGAHFRALENLGEVLAEVCATEGVRTAVVSRDPECEGVGGQLTSHGVSVREPDSAAACAAVDLGVTGAAYGIALTGSVVVAADRAGCRTASLLPPVHVAIVRVGRLLATPEELFRHLPRRFPRGMPSNLVLITGPSRSADIELQLTLGVHGPRSLWVVLV
jgi:L-lactate dehydrogenase complex protein LldG